MSESINADLLAALERTRTTLHILLNDYRHLNPDPSLVQVEDQLAEADAAIARARLA